VSLVVTSGTEQRCRVGPEIFPSEGAIPSLRGLRFASSRTPSPSVLLGVNYSARVSPCASVGGPDEGDGPSTVATGRPHDLIDDHYSSYKFQSGERVSSADRMSSLHSHHRS
jgi:hypothetical protein